MMTKWFPTQETITKIYIDEIAWRLWLSCTVSFFITNKKEARRLPEI